jgi:four helix bundle protein
VFRFQKLDVWQRSVVFARRVYDLTRRFPSDERFGLTNQIRRAAVSISSNIAEGSGRVSDGDFARVLEFAYGSLMEVISQCVIANEQGFLAKEALDSLHQEAEEIARMLSGLRSSLADGKAKKASVPALDSRL